MAHGGRMFHILVTLGAGVGTSAACGDLPASESGGSAGSGGSDQEPEGGVAMSSGGAAGAEMIGHAGMPPEVAGAGGTSITLIAKDGGSSAMCEHPEQFFCAGYEPARFGCYCDPMAPLSEQGCQGNFHFS